LAAQGCDVFTGRPNGVVDCAMAATSNCHHSAWRCRKTASGKTMAGYMVLWNGVPADMLDRHPCLIADRIETYLNLRDLIGCEAGLPPCEGE
jgi:hypothetical protein